MVLVHSVFNGTMPHGSTADLFRTSIPFDHKQIAGPQPKPVELSLEQLDFVHIGKIQQAAPHVGNTQKWELVLNRTAFGLLLDSTADVTDLVQSDPSPPRRKLPLPVHAAALAQASS
nr:hypothetical protein [Streptomyces fodineus]